MWSAIFNVLFHFAVGFVIGLFIVSIVGAILNRINHYWIKKRVLTAIKALDIEDELAKNVAGCNARCLLAIEQYFIKHRWGTPFEGAPGTFKLCYLIGELRTEGKVKQLAKGGK